MKDRPTNNSMLSASIALKEAGGRFLGPILDAIPLALAILDMNTTIVAVNRSFEKLSRLRKKEVEGVRSWTEFFLEEDVQWMREHHDSRRRDPSSAPNSYESHFINANGSVRTVSLRISMIPGTALSIVALSDITAKKRREERLVHQAFHDQLTGLPNRALLMDRLSHALSSAERDSNMIGGPAPDLDEFKRVNDTYGHPFGDSVLRSAAERIRNCLRKKDTVARIGGDEFVIIVDDAVDSRDLAQVANTIIQRFSSPFVVNGQTVYLGISIGIALYPADGDMPELLIKNADLAMYRSKQKGKNTFNLFTQDLDERLLERLTLENDLRQAILSDRFAVRYQPCLHADGKTVLGVQAVVRWYRSDGREVLPKEIFRLAQETGVAVPLERRILETACREAVPWVARFPASDSSSRPARPTSWAVISCAWSPRPWRKPDFPETGWPWWWKRPPPCLTSPGSSPFSRSWPSLVPASSWRGSAPGAPP